MSFNRINHIGINVINLAAAKAFFLDLGCKLEGENTLQGEFVEKVIGLKNVKDDVVMVSFPGGGVTIELVQFHSPVDENGIQPSLANTLGIRHFAIEVDDVDAVVARAKSRGAELVGEIQQYEDVWKDCFLYGPEGIILELAQRLK